VPERVETSDHATGESIMLSLYRPFSSLFRDEYADRDWSSLFFANPVLSSAAVSGAAGRAASFTPAVDVVEQDQAYLLRAEIPGIAPTDIDVQVENDVLTLRGERKHENQEERAGYRRVERSYGSFSRTFVLPRGTHVDSIEARAENGVLTISIPKVQTASARKVEVKGEGLVDKAKKIFAKSDEPASA
jgi:HSP20 family protein